MSSGESLFGGGPKWSPSTTIKLEPFEDEEEYPPNGKFEFLNIKLGKRKMI